MSLWDDEIYVYEDPFENPDCPTIREIVAECKRIHLSVDEQYDSYEKVLEYLQEAANYATYFDQDQCSDWAWDFYTQYKKMWE